MTASFKYFGDEDRDEIDALVSDARMALHNAGLAVHGPRFPFAMHHAIYRNKLPRIGKNLFTHFEVAGLLNTWAVARNSRRDYVAQAIHGALVSISGENYEIASVPEAVRNDIEKVSSGSDFRNWVFERVGKRVKTA
jgi:hypothetical protein